MHASVTPEIVEGTGRTKADERAAGHPRDLRRLTNVHVDEGWKHPVVSIAGRIKKAERIFVNAMGNRSRGVAFEVAGTIRAIDETALTAKLFSYLASVRSQITSRLITLASNSGAVTTVRSSQSFMTIAPDATTTKRPI